MKDYPNNTQYAVDAEGSVFSKNYRGSQATRKLSPIKHNAGYMRVNIGGKMTSVHRVIAETYIPNPCNKPEVDHIDGDKANNRVSNLRWATHKENINYAMKMKGNWLDKIPRKLTPISKDTNGTIVSYRSMKEASIAHDAEYHVFASRVCNAILRGSRSYGAYWERM